LGGEPKPPALVIVKPKPKKQQVVLTPEEIVQRRILYCSGKSFGEKDFEMVDIGEEDSDPMAKRCWSLEVERLVPGFAAWIATRDVDSYDPAFTVRPSVYNPGGANSNTGSSRRTHHRSNSSTGTPNTRLRSNTTRLALEKYDVRTVFDLLGLEKSRLYSGWNSQRWRVPDKVEGRKVTCPGSARLNWALYVKSPYYKLRTSTKTAKPAAEKAPQPAERPSKLEGAVNAVVDGTKIKPVGTGASTTTTTSPGAGGSTQYSQNKAATAAPKIPVVDATHIAPVSIDAAVSSPGTPAPSNSKKTYSTAAASTAYSTTNSTGTPAPTAAAEQKNPSQRKRRSRKRRRGRKKAGTKRVCQVQHRSVDLLPLNMKDDMLRIFTKGIPKDHFSKGNPPENIPRHDLALYPPEPVYITQLHKGFPRAGDWVVMETAPTYHPDGSITKRVYHVMHVRFNDRLEKAFRKGAAKIRAQRRASCRARGVKAKDCRTGVGSVNLRGKDRFIALPHPFEKYIPGTDENPDEETRKKFPFLDQLISSYAFNSDTGNSKGTKKPHPHVQVKLKRTDRHGKTTYKLINPERFMVLHETEKKSSEGLEPLLDAIAETFSDMIGFNPQYALQLQAQERGPMMGKHPTSGAIGRWQVMPQSVSIALAQAKEVFSRKGDDEMLDKLELADIIRKLSADVEKVRATPKSERKNLQLRVGSDPELNTQAGVLIAHREYEQLGRDYQKAAGGYNKGRGAVRWAIASWEFHKQMYPKLVEKYKKDLKEFESTRKGKRPVKPEVPKSHWAYYIKLNTGHLRKEGVPLERIQQAYQGMLDKRRYSGGSEWARSNRARIGHVYRTISYINKATRGVVPRQIPDALPQTQQEKEAFYKPMVPQEQQKPAPYQDQQRKQPQLRAQKNHARRKI
jgi:hypothetical protein